VSDVDEALATRGGRFWIHAGLADTRCRIWLEHHAPLSVAARDVLLGADEHLHVEVMPDDIAGVLPDLQRDLTEPAMEFGRFRFALTPTLLVTARRHSLHSLELTRRSIEAGTRFPTTISLLDGIIDHFVDVIARQAEQLGDELDVVEDAVMRDDLGDERQR